MIEDWDDAYANGAHIEAAAEYPEKWARLAAAYRQQMVEKQQVELDVVYGTSERQRLDVFYPDKTPVGLVMFVHGGYWRAFDKNSWSHLATAAVMRGWAVVMPSYDLVPTVRISEITGQIAAALTRAGSLVSGPVRLTGHSAGGHLVTRMICQDSPLQSELSGRIERVVSISGLHDLRPLLKTKMNEDFCMFEGEAIAESPALNQPLTSTELVCWVGAEERPEFVRQADLLANIWVGCGISTSLVHAPGQHHFDVIDGLVDADSALCRALLD